jgi:chromosome segregation protein
MAARHELESAPPLWQKIHVEAGWEDAVEAVLRERLSAIACDDPAKLDEWLHDRPRCALERMLGDVPARSRPVRRGQQPGRPRAL